MKFQKTLAIVLFLASLSWVASKAVAVQKGTVGVNDATAIVCVDPTNWTVSGCGSTISAATLTSSPNVNIASVGGTAIGTSVPVTLQTGTNSVGSVLQGTVPWNVGGSVQAALATLPALAAGNNSIGSVTVIGQVSISTITSSPINVNCTGCSAASAVSATITNTPLSVFATVSSVTPVVGASVTIAGCASAVCAAPGQVSMASSTSVVIANNQSPVSVGGLSATSLPTAAANASITQVMVDKFGRVVTAPQGDRAIATRGSVNIATTAETTLIKAAGASTFWDLTSLACSNRDSSSATRVDIRDTTAGTVIHSMSLAAGQGGFVLPFYVPLPQTTANSTWTVQMSVNVSSGIDCNFIAVKNQ